MAKANYGTGYTGGLKKGKSLPIGTASMTSAKVTVPHSAKKSTKKGTVK